MRTRTVKLSDIELDEELHPRRGKLNDTHTADMVATLEAGGTLPPMVVSVGLILIDGWHRHRALTRFFGPDTKIRVAVRDDLKTERQIYEATIQANTEHGLKLSKYDRVAAALRAEELGTPRNRLPALFGVTAERFGKWLEGSVAHVGTRRVATKHTLRHKADQELTPQQEAANTRAGGMSATYFANQLLNLLEADLIDKENTTLVGKLRALHELLGGMLASV